MTLCSIAYVTSASVASEAAAAAAFDIVMQVETTVEMMMFEN